MRLLGSALFLLLFLGPALAADAPKVRQLRTQTIDDVTYFHARLDAPADLRLPSLPRPAVWNAGDLIRLGQLPRLVPRDQRCRAVHLAVDIPDKAGRQIRVLSQGNLEFAGQVRGRDPVTLLLLYPTDPKPPAAGPPDPDDADLSKLLPRVGWVDVPLVLDFSRAEAMPAGDELRKVWATAQAGHFALSESQAPTFGFYGVACSLTARKYGVKEPGRITPGSSELPPFFARLYESAADATILAAAAQARRLAATSPREPEQRTIDIAKVPGVDLPERPWDKLLAGKPSEPEPLAKLIPQDNLYAHFKSVVPIVDLLDLFAEIQQTGFQEVEGNSRDYQLQPRYERQFAIQIVSLARLFGPAVVRNVAVTASDPYVREGTDLAAVFQVVNRTFFLLAQETFIAAARREWGKELREAKEEYQGVTIESFVTPRREVSLYRAAFGDYLVLANSPLAVRRIIDTSRGKVPSMAEAPDFRYYRSVYPYKDAVEDGYVYLSTAFLRRVLGPVAFVKRRRRLEAFVSMYLVSNAALFAAWETGTLPRDHQALLAESALRPEDIAFPDGAVTWNGVKQQAVSEEFNTFTFATPMAEMSVDKITAAEEKGYQEARQGYRSLMGKTLEPIALRLTLNARLVKVEVSLAPMPQLESIKNVLENASGGTTPPSFAVGGRDTLLLGLAHLSPGFQAYVSKKDLLGDWAFLRLDDTDQLSGAAEAFIRQEVDPAAFDAMQLRAERAFFRLPLLAGVGVKDRKNFDKFLNELIDLAALVFGPFERERRTDQKGVPVIRVRATRDSWLVKTLNPTHELAADPVVPSLSWAHLDGGWYASFQEPTLREALDGVLFRQRFVGPPRPDEGVNALGSLSPGAVVRGGPGASQYLEWINHRRALMNCPIWQSLFRANVFPEEVTTPQLRSTALRLLSFIPVSPEGAIYTFDPRYDEVTSPRHGSPRRPRLHEGQDVDSPQVELARRFPRVSSEVRFRDDGLYLIAEVERRSP